MLLPFLAASWWIIEKPGVVFDGKMNGPAVLRVRTGLLAGAGDVAAGKTDFWAFKLRPAFDGFCTVTAHGIALAAYGDAIFIDGEILLIHRRSATLAIEVNEGGYVVLPAVQVVRHGIMGGVQKQFRDLYIGKEALHGEPIVEKPMGVMSGGRPEERENWQVAFRIGGGKHVEAVTEVVPVPMGIPADVAVGLAVKAVAFAVMDTFFKAVAGTLLTFARGGIDRSPVTGNGKILQGNKAKALGMVQEQGFEDLEEAGTRIHICGRLRFELFKEFFHSSFSNR